MYYSSFGLLALILNFIINYESFKLKKSPSVPLAQIRYKYFLCSVTLYYVADIFWGLLYESGIRPLAYADTVVYFMSMVASLYFWTRYVIVYLNKKSRFDRVLTWGGRIIFTFQALNLVINFFSPVVFEFTGDGEYLPGPTRYVTLALQIMLFLMTSMYTLIIADRGNIKTRHHEMAIGISGIVMTVFILLQTLYPLLPFYAIGCLIANCFVHTFVGMDERIERELELGKARYKAFNDALTGVKNNNAYNDAKAELNERIAKKAVREFAVVVFDLNGLKRINDGLGHEEGDRFIKNACGYICRQFMHSPVFRIGGDEFLTLLEGEDYSNRIKLIDEFDRLMDKNAVEGGVVAASGMAEYDSERDADVDSVFARADHIMYARKRALKEMPARSRRSMT